MNPNTSTYALRPKLIACLVVISLFLWVLIIVAAQNIYYSQEIYHKHTIQE